MFSSIQHVYSSRLAFIMSWALYRSRPNFGANVFWQSFLNWGLDSQPWKFPQQMWYQKKQEKYICQFRCYFQFHMKITCRYQSVNFLLTHTVYMYSYCCSSGCSPGGSTCLSETLLEYVIDLANDGHYLQVGIVYNKDCMALRLTHIIRGHWPNKSFQIQSKSTCTFILSIIFL